MPAHAILSASSAARWLQCPPSARLNAAVPDTVSEYAAEGTRAHAAAEACLNAYLKGRKAKPKYDDGEMEEAVTRYVDVCVEKITAARKATKDAVIRVEQRLDFSAYVKDGFGTGDMVIISDDVLEIVDLKYGKGVPVSAVHNPQMRLYALGAIEEYALLYGFANVRMTIVQPRLDSISSDIVGVSDLITWGEGIKKTADLAFEGKGEFAAGDHCRFCKVRAQCRALADYELAEVNKYLPDEAWELEPDSLTAILRKAGDIKNWLKDVEEYALTEALGGREWPDMKLVEGRSRRTIADPEAAADVLQQEGYTPEEVYKPKELQTLTHLDKLVGKKRLAELLHDYIVKPQGKPTLVGIEDPRPVFQRKVEFDDDMI